MSDDPAPKPATKRDPVVEAFNALIQELGARAIQDPIDHEAFERAAAFRRRVSDLATRWSDGKPAHTPRGGKAEG